MFRFKMTPFLSLVLIALLTPVAQADPVEDYKALSRDYARSYSESLLLSKSASRQTRLLEQAVQEKEQLVLDKTSELSSMEKELSQTKDQLERLRMNHSFLSQMIPLAQKKQEAIKQEAAGSSEYQSGEKVDLNSLERKAAELQKQMDDLQSHIDQLNQSIKNIEDSEPYQSRVSEVLSARSRLRQAEAEISELEDQISDLSDEIRNEEYKKSQLEREISDNESRIRELEWDIPRKESEIQDLERRIPGLEGKIQKLQSQKQDLGNKIRALESRKSGLDPKKDKDKIAKIENQISQLASRWHQVDDDIDDQKRQLRSVEWEVSSKERDLNSLKDEKEDLEDELDDNEDDLSDLERSLSSHRSDLDDHERDLDSARYERDRRERLLDQAQSELNSYHREHISPLEAQIAQIQTQKDGLEKRKLQLLAWRDGLVRQDQNISKAEADIGKSQTEENASLKLIDGLKAGIQTAQESLKNLSSQLAEAKETLAGYVQMVSAKRQQTLALEKQMEELKNQIIGTDQ